MACYPDVNSRWKWERAENFSDKELNNTNTINASQHDIVENSPDLTVQKSNVIIACRYHML